MATTRRNTKALNKEGNVKPTRCLRWFRCYEANRRAEHILQAGKVYDYRVAKMQSLRDCRYVGVLTMPKTIAKSVRFSSTTINKASRVGRIMHQMFFTFSLTYEAQKGGYYRRGAQIQQA